MEQFVTDFLGTHLKDFGTKTCIDVETWEKH